MTPELFTQEEYQGLQTYFASPSLETAQNIERLLIQKRDTDFVQNIFAQSPRRKDVVIIVGQGHQWGVFSKLQQFYYNPKLMPAQKRVKVQKQQLRSPIKRSDSRALKRADKETPALKSSGSNRSGFLGQYQKPVMYLAMATGIAAAAFLGFRASKKNPHTLKTSQ
jgi:hypothetical protein